MDENMSEVWAEITKAEAIIAKRQVALIALQTETRRLIKQHQVSIARAKKRLTVAKKMIVKMRLAKKYGLHV